MVIVIIFKRPILSSRSPFSLPSGSSRSVLFLYNHLSFVVLLLERNSRNNAPPARRSASFDTVRRNDKCYKNDKN
jgi:hypothetical protein